MTTQPIQKFSDNWFIKNTKALLKSHPELKIKTLNENSKTINEIEWEGMDFQNDNGDFYRLTYFSKYENKVNWACFQILYINLNKTSKTLIRSKDMKVIQDERFPIFNNKILCPTIDDCEQMYHKFYERQSAQLNDTTNSYIIPMNSTLGERLFAVLKSDKDYKFIIKSDIKYFKKFCKGENCMCSTVIYEAILGNSMTGSIYITNSDIKNYYKRMR